MGVRPIDRNARLASASISGIARGYVGGHRRDMSVDEATAEIGRVLDDYRIEPERRALVLSDALQPYAGDWSTYLRAAAMRDLRVACGADVELAGDIHREMFGG
jgi:hypothetical protein